MTERIFDPKRFINRFRKAIVQSDETNIPKNCPRPEGIVIGLMEPTEKGNTTYIVRCIVNQLPSAKGPYPERFSICQECCFKGFYMNSDTFIQRGNNPISHI